MGAGGFHAFHHGGGEGKGEKRRRKMRKRLGQFHVHHCPVCQVVTDEVCYDDCFYTENGVSIGYPERCMRHVRWWLGRRPQRRVLNYLLSGGCRLKFVRQCGGS